MPKIKDAPLPQGPGVFSVYLDSDKNVMRARFHKPGNFHVFVFDGQLENPEAFCHVVDQFRKKNNK